MENIYRNLSAFHQWGTGWGSENTFQVTELWRSSSTGEVVTKTKSIGPADRQGWLSQGTSDRRDNETLTLLVRFVWLDINVKDQIIRQSEDTTNFLVNVFGLQLAYGYARSCLAGATKLPTQGQGTDTVSASYCVCYTPKIAAVWSQRQPNSSDPGTGLTQGIYFVQREEKTGLQAALQGRWSVAVCENALFPALLVALLLGVQMDRTVDTIKNTLRAVESRTGYHDFANRYEAPAKEELGELSARTSGTATKLASTMRKAKTLGKLLAFMESSLDESMRHCRKMLGTFGVQTAVANEATQALEACTLLKHHINVLLERQEMQVMDTDYTLKRAKVQTYALFSIIQQHDAMNNLALSKATHQIAYSSYRDSSSMKTLAVVTMFFLPGSFISALFSTNIFEWSSVDNKSDEISVKMAPQFRLYWAITIPLTLLTFLLYFAWLVTQKRNHSRLLHRSSIANVGADRGRSLAMAGSIMEEEGEGRTLARMREALRSNKTGTAAGP